ncbi:MAG: hypothetical protein RLZZ384_551 [Pseudomonadota bacterium]
MPIDKSIRCLTILVIDDILVIDLLQKKLTYFGHSVIAFHDVFSALNAFDTNPSHIDVIITDKKFTDILKSASGMGSDSRIDAIELFANAFKTSHCPPMLIWGEMIESQTLEFNPANSLYFLNKNLSALKVIGDWLAIIAKASLVSSMTEVEKKNSIYQLVYASKAIDLFCENDLIAILSQARKFNQLANITGTLVYHSGFFLQLLEGDHADVTNLFYAHIVNDKRHQNVTVFHEGYAPKREFPNWRMGFYGTNDNENYPLLGLTDFKHHPAGEFFRRHLTQMQKHFLHFELDDFDYLPCLILITDNNGLVLKANFELLALIGEQRYAVEGKSMNALFPPASRIFLQTHIWPMLCHKGHVNEIHLKLYGHNKTRIPVVLNSRKGTFDNAESYFWTFFVTVERDKLEVELLESQRRTQSILKAIFNISPNGYLLIDEADRILFANDMMTGLVEMTTERLHDLSGAQFWHHLSTYSQKNIVIPSCTYDTIYIDLIKPRIHKLVCGMHPVVLPNGKTLGNLFYFNDITKEEESNRIKAEFLTHASHELRTPLASIHGYSELLANDLIPIENQLSVAHILYEQSTWLMVMLDELLDLSRIETRAGIGFEKHHYHLHNLIHDAIDQFIVPYGRKEIIYTTPPELLEMKLYVDKMKFTQVIHYIIDNAYKYSANDGKVSIFTRMNATNNALEIEIIDEGIGVCEKNIPLIFERFFRVDKSGNLPGIGLGLTIAKEIMFFLNGEIRFNSVINQGSRVVVCFYW